MYSEKTSTSTSTKPQTRRSLHPLDKVTSNSSSLHTTTMTTGDITDARQRFYALDDFHQSGVRRVSFSAGTLAPDNDKAAGFAGEPRVAEDVDDDATDTASLGEVDASRMHEFTAPFGVRLTKSGSRVSGSAAERKKENSRHRALQWLFAFYSSISPSLILVNKGSVARDHLSNERTYLAWLRTSLSVITVGVAITQLFRLESADAPNSRYYAGRPLGGAFLALGILFLLFAVARYFHTQGVMAEGQFPASRGIVFMGSTGVMAVLLAMFVVIVIV